MPGVPGASPFDNASDVTHSTAYAVLNALVEEGQIPEERADYLRQKFKDLHDRVLAIYKRDNTLLKRARHLRGQLETERQHVLGCGTVARGDDETIQALKRKLMEQERDLTSALERESVLQVEVLEYERRKQQLLLEREDAVAAEEARLRPKLDTLEAEVKEMSRRIQEMAQHNEEAIVQRDAASKEEEACKQEIAAFSTIITQAKKQLLTVDREPERAQKQLEMVLRSLSGAQKELSSMEEKIALQEENISALEKQRQSRSADCDAVKARAQAIRTDMEAKRKALTAINTSFEVELEAKQSYQDRVAELEQLILTTRIGSQQEVDGLERMDREREKCMREYSILIQAKEDVQHETKSLVEQLRVLDKEMASLLRIQKDVSRLLADTKKEAEVRARMLLKEQAKEVDFTAKANSVLGELQDVEDSMNEKSKLEEVKRRELVALAAKRQEFSRESMREASRVTLAQQELKMKDLHLAEVRRRQEELEKRLAKLVDLFQNVKQDRAEKAGQIQAITQKMTEIVEKTKILEKELEVLTREAAVKEQDIAKKRYQVHEMTQICTKLRMEKNRYRKNLEKVVDSEREVKAQVRRLNSDVAAVEDTMVDIKNSFKVAMDNRDKTGIQLIDRNDALSLLVERVKAQEAAIDDGTAMSNARADEVRRLKLQLGAILHDIEACQQSIPKVSQMEMELTKLTSDIEDERWRFQVIEADITDPKNPQRWKQIPATELQLGHTAAAVLQTEVAKAESEGTDETTATASAMVGGPSDTYVSLQARCQDLEARVSALDAKIREKDLLFEEVKELAERVGAQATAGKDGTLALAKQMNRQQHGLRTKTRQMMATISELSLFQSSSIQLQQEVQRLEEVVAQAEERLEAGEAPYAEAAEQYDREKASRERYVAMLRRNKEEEAASSALGNPAALLTTAEPRATAYVSDDALGLPRPFGPFAPFKGSAVKTTEATTAQRNARSPPPTLSSRSNHASPNPLRSSAPSTLGHGKDGETGAASEEQPRLSQRTSAS